MSGHKSRVNLETYENSARLANGKKVREYTGQANRNFSIIKRQFSLGQFQLHRK